MKRLIAALLALFATDKWSVKFSFSDILKLYCPFYITPAIQYELWSVSKRRRPRYNSDMDIGSCALLFCWLKWEFAIIVERATPIEVVRYESDN